MLHAASLAFNQVFSKPFRGVFWKSLGLTLALLALLWAGVQALLVSFVTVPYPWLETLIGLLSGVGMLIALGFFIAPVTSIFAGIFLDEIAEQVEHRFYPQDPAGKSMPIIRSLGMTAKFLVVVIGVNIVALVLFFVLGLGIPIFLIANGYLLGREYFELAAARFLPAEEARALRRENALRVFLAGLVVAGFLAIPFLNLLTPLFATAFMVHVHKMISGSARPVLE
ncbi:MAG: sulfate transporter family protein [Rhizobiales bacterium]|nr:sulfate transporter family protein [Hyphomicrobiales bacterium]